MFFAPTGPDVCVGLLLYLSLSFMLFEKIDNRFGICLNQQKPPAHVRQWTVREKAVKVSGYTEKDFDYHIKSANYVTRYYVAVSGVVSLST